MSQIFSSVERERYNELLVIDGHDGCYVYSEGKKYLDSISCLWNKNLGYNDEEVIEAITNQIKVCGTLNPWISTTEINKSYAEELLRFAEYLDGNVYFSLSGSESIEVAIKATRKYHNLNGNDEKKLIVSFDKSYHGGTIGAWSISGTQRRLFEPYSPLMGGHVFIPFIHDKVTLKFFREYVKQYHKKTAAIIIEPIICYGGGFEIPKWVMEEIVSICKNYEIQIIFDEVSTGFYRTGEKFAYIDLGIRPDIICLSKGINNGILPFGVTIFKNNVFEKLGTTDAFEHFSTQNFNPILTASAMYVLKKYKEKDYKEKVLKLSTLFKQEIEMQLAPYLSKFFIKGLFITLEFHSIVNHEVLMCFFEELLRNGLITYVYSNDTNYGITLVPMFITESEEITEIVNIIKRTYEEMFEI
ncbi:TPA: aspartate aminotransferase family protein [Streptococcus equi subsp. zooepidemicus]|nr:aspartate aminotransferase family protein [Streptococcus equi subsp. zooepidemicus]